MVLRVVSFHLTFSTWMVDCRSAAELRREDSLVPFVAFVWYPRDLYNPATSRAVLLIIKYYVYYYIFIYS